MMRFIRAAPPVFALVVIVGACDLRNALAPTSSRAKHESCEAWGGPLDPGDAFKRREQWDKIEGVRRQARGDQGPALAMTLQEACTAARDFEENCPAWDPEVQATSKDVCRFAMSGGVNSHWGCEPGERLDANTARYREGRWQALLAVRRAKGWPVPEPTLTLEASCEDAHDFAANCGAWDRGVRAVESEVCAIAANDCAPNILPSRRKGMAPHVRRNLEGLLSSRLDLPGMRDPELALKPIASAMNEARLLKCLDGSTMEAQIEEWATQRTAAVEEEKKCRATVPCMADRVGMRICAELEEKRDASARMAAERSNPSGVVSLRVLHDLGQRVQYHDATISELRAEYTSMVRRPFNEAACPR